MNNKIFESELEYFNPILKRLAKYSDFELEAFRGESVRERKKRVSLEVYNLTSGYIKYGPFRNMKLSSDTWWGNMDLGSMCLGEYEKEILEQLVIIGEKSNKLTFIDVGAADGYYAVGMLFGKYAQKAICFEISQEGRRCILENWKKNNSEGQLLIFGDVFSDFDLNTSDIDFKNCVILIDIEGFEFDFLTSNRLKKISEATILIEIHHWIPDFLLKYESLLKRCENNFIIEIIKPNQRKTDGFHELRDFTDDNRYLVFSESRPSQMRFLKLSPKLKD